MKEKELITITLRNKSSKKPLVEEVVGALDTSRVLTQAMKVNLGRNQDSRSQDQTL